MSDILEKDITDASNAKLEEGRYWTFSHENPSSEEVLEQILYQSLG
jgi:hypothetical protein